MSDVERLIAAAKSHERQRDARTPSAASTAFAAVGKVVGLLLALTAVLMYASRGTVPMITASEISWCVFGVALLAWSRNVRAYLCHSAQLWWARIAVGHPRSWATRPHRWVVALSVITLVAIFAPWLPARLFHSLDLAMRGGGSGGDGLTIAAVCWAFAMWGVYMMLLFGSSVGVALWMRHKRMESQHMIPQAREEER